MILLAMLLIGLPGSGGAAVDNPEELSKKILEEVREDATVVTYRGKVETRLGKMNFEIHAGRNDLDIAHEVINVLQKDIPLIVDYYDWLPRPTVHFIIDSETMIANGWAMVFPENRIAIYIMPPIGRSSLLINTDWTRALVIHEFAHIVHMDQTRGLLKWVRSVFGSFAKWGGVVPTWFTEGVATWTETHFTRGGRLRSIKIHDDLVRFFTGPGKCRDISCLDDPGVYPYGDLAYWAGVAFLDYLEQQKTGTISCLVKANSDSFPFFLNSSFRECTSMTASDAFDLFLERRYPLNSQASGPVRFAGLEWRRMENPPERSVSWETGERIVGDFYLFDEVFEDVPRLCVMNLETGKRRLHKFPWRMEFIGPASTDSAAVIGTFSPESDNFIRRAVLFDPVKMKEQQILKGVGPYFFPIEGKKCLELSFSDKRWILLKGDCSKDDKQELLRFPFGVMMAGAQIHVIDGKNFLGFLTGSKTGDSYYLIDIDSLGKGRPEIRRAFESKAGAAYLGACGRRFIFRDLEGKISIVDDAGKGLSLSKKKSEKITDLVIGAKWSLLRMKGAEKSFFVHKGSCNKIFDALEANGEGEKISIEAVDEAFEVSVGEANNLAPAVLTAKDSERKAEIKREWNFYPGLRHFRPHFWLFTFTGGENNDAVEFFTTISDPKERHTIAPSGRYYFDFKKTSGSVFYNYSRDNWNLGLYYGQIYSESTLSERPNSNALGSVSLGRSFHIATFSWNPALVYERQIEDDFLSRRKQERYKLFQQFSWQAHHADDFFQLWVLRLISYVQHTKFRKDFWGLQAKTVLDISLSRNLKTNFNVAYGRLFKKDFSSGIIFGGGTSSNPYGLDQFYEFYGIPYGDIFGNKVMTARAQMYWIADRVYGGVGLFPWYTRKIGLVFGADFVKADWLVVQDKLFRDKNLTSVHAGPRLEGTIFYQIPVSLDVLGTYILTNTGKKEGRGGALVLLKASMF
jgi:hypothetical protein